LQKQKQQQQQQQQSTQEAASSSAPEVPVQPVTREFSALGSKVVESNVPFKGPEDEPDFWEGNQFDVSSPASMHGAYVVLQLNHIGSCMGVLQRRRVW
jgi:hypothetical protein